MAATKVVPVNRDAWLKLRSVNINSTEVSALAGKNPYMTAYELGLIKSGQVTDEVEETERMAWGNRLQWAIAQGAAEDQNIEILNPPPKTNRGKRNDPYFYIPSIRMGSSIDYLVKCPTKGYGLMEIKNVDQWIYKTQWTDDEAPAHIQIQVQHQMEVANIEWCLIVALVGGNTLKIIECKRDRKVGQALRSLVEKFWRDLDDGKLPPINFIQDAEFVIDLHQEASEETLDATSDGKIESLVKRYNHCATEEKFWGREKDAAKAELLTLIGDHGKVIGNGYSIACNRTQDSFGTLVTADMVGTYVGGRKGYRQFKVTFKKEQ